ncbi:MAG: hypothetical protein JJE22_14795 [Bacteroidia bacterium]|nr:hypothetical protein [Bacteroidia bacterium]
MRLTYSLLFTVTALFSSVLHAQTVDEIINKHIEAIGGKEKLNEVKSLYIENSMEVMGNEAPQTEYLLEGKGYKTEMEFNGSKIINCYNDKGGWSINPMMGGSNAEPMKDVLYKAGKVQIYAGGALVDYAAKGYKAELAGMEDGNYKIKIVDGDKESYYYIDPKSSYITKSIIKSEMMDQPVDVTTIYSDYRKTDFGIVMPYAKNIDMGMFQLSSKVNKVEVNKDIDIKIFEMPK